MEKEYLKVTLGVDNLAEALGSDVVEPVTNKRKSEIIEEKQKHSRNGADHDKDEDDSSDKNDPDISFCPFPKPYGKNKDVARAKLWIILSGRRFLRGRDKLCLKNIEKWSYVCRYAQAITAIDSPKYQI